MCSLRNELILATAIRTRRYESRALERKMAVVIAMSGTTVRVTSAILQSKINIANFALGRKDNSGLALGALEVDSDIDEETKKKRVLKNVCSRYEMNLVNGIRSCSAQNCGISTTVG